MILITGAAGKTGQAIIKALSSKSVKVRALVHRKSQVNVVKSAGASTVIVGDMGEEKQLASAFSDVQIVYHICPNVSPREVEFGGKILEASMRKGIDRLVYHSVLHPQIEAMPHHWAKMRVEELIFETGIPFTILQPAAYMQNLLAYWKDIVAGKLSLPYRPETRLGMVDLVDVAEVAARVILEPRHEGAIYELCGPGNHSQIELADEIGQVLGIDIEVDYVGIDTWKAGAKKSGLGPYQISSLISMFEYYDKYGFWGNSNVLQWLLGRKPHDVKSFVDRFLFEESASV
jgi:uncharacterized protein YbjT (DUF2867 family)